MSEHCCEHCTNSSEDHDILIGIRSDMKNFIYVSQDHETRIRRTEQWGFLAIGALAIVDLIIMLAITAWKAKP